MTTDYDHKKIEAKWKLVWEKKGVYEPFLAGARQDKPVAKAKNPAKGEARQRRPFYNLMMFPYPSAEGLHVGNVYAFVGSDVYGRFTRMRGNDVFEPIGLDGFGIHSENYALIINEHPAEVAKRTEANFYRQLRLIGNGFAWGAKLETYDPSYYKWTQWIFTTLFKAGLAYRANAVVNWCPNCKTVLSDEQVVGRKLGNWVGRRVGKEPNNPNTQKPNNLVYVCERCATEVVERELTQWFFRITAYAQRLLDGLAVIDWSEKVKLAQVNWLGKSKGVTLRFASDIDSTTRIEVFTTRPDTVFGVTYVALAPEHPLVIKIIDQAKGLLQQEIQQYVGLTIEKRKSERNAKGRAEKEKEKTGVKTPFHAINPLSGVRVPIFIADYVLTEYGSGAVMGVPAHDQRDCDFARKYHLDILEVVSGSDISRKAFTGAGMIINSGKFNGLSSDEAIGKISDEIAKVGSGEVRVLWHLRDWIISRQRYWGPPIPMIFCGKCAEEGKSWFTTKEVEKFVGGPVTSSPPTNARSKLKDLFGNRKSEDSENATLRVSGSPSRSATPKFGNLTLGIGHSGYEMAGWYPVPDEDLPVELPYIKNFKPTGTGVSPLATDPKFVNVKCPGCGGSAKRETDVSDTFLDSAWYFLRYPSVSSKESKDQRVRESKSAWDPGITKKWLPVDMYIGGAEHSVLHLLYARFLTKVFYDLKLVDFDEPFTKFRANGLLIRDGAKMSKSKGNVVSPDEYIEKYGADTLRCYLMFCGRFVQGGDFRDGGIGGMRRFLGRVFRLVGNWVVGEGSSPNDPKTQNPNNLHMMHKTIKKVTADIQNLDYNTAISAIMEWVNFLENVSGPVAGSSHPTSSTKSGLKQNSDHKVGLRALDGTPSARATRDVSKEELEVLLKLIAPFAPYMTEELWAQIGNTNSIHLAVWSAYREELAVQEKVVLVVQVNGKVRERIEVVRGISESDAAELAMASENVSKFLGGKVAKKVVYVPDRLINLVV